MTLIVALVATAIFVYRRPDELDTHLKAEFTGTEYVAVFFSPKPAEPLSYAVATLMSGYGVILDHAPRAPYDAYAPRPGNRQTCLSEANHCLSVDTTIR